MGYSVLWFDLETSIVSIACFVLLTFNVATAAFQFRDDPPAVAFVVSLYGFLMLFFVCVNAFQRLPEKSDKRKWLKIPIWALAVLLNVMFARRVSMMLHEPLSWLVWAMAGSYCLVAFYLFFIYPPTVDEKSKVVAHQPLLARDA